ncbi:MAG TPA: hypothetical protein VEJ84_05765 [Acidimicrobiales bacterium]|nr:hypothetical protein [Acidimicrobiales bacterium]
MATHGQVTDFDVVIRVPRDWEQALEEMATARQADTLAACAKQLLGEALGVLVPRELPTSLIYNQGYDAGLAAARSALQVARRRPND